MKASEINKKISIFSNTVIKRQNEILLRNEAQSLFLLIKTEKSVKEAEKEQLMNRLRIAVRPLARLYYKSDSEVCEIGALLSEICLAASFYLLESEKRIRLYETDNKLFVKINRRSFENRFFSIISPLLKTNNEISVETRFSGHCCSVIVSADNISQSLIACPPESSFIVFENGMYSLALNMEISDFVPLSYDYEDFSMLLFDALSPMHVWLCDI